jgi:two-component system, chemotaxis family, chemotaxis protein CheY
MKYSLPVLVVDDFKSVVSLAARVLNQIGFEQVDTAETGAEALQKAQSKRYGLIVSDLHMKPMSGTELIWHLKTDARTSSVPTIVLTGDPLEATLTAAKQAGASSIVLKPPSPGMLKKLLQDAIQELA